MTFNKEEMDIGFFILWNKRMDESHSGGGRLMSINEVEEIAHEYYDAGQKSVYDSTMEFLGVTKSGLVDWLHDKLGIN